MRLLITVGESSIVNHRPALGAGERESAVLVLYVPVTLDRAFMATIRTEEDSFPP